MQNNTIRQSNYEKIVEAVMVIKYTNIKNTNNLIALHNKKHQQTQKTTTNKQTNDIWRWKSKQSKSQKCGRITRVNGIQTTPLDNWISNGNTYNKQTIKNLHRFASTQKTTYIYIIVDLFYENGFLKLFRVKHINDSIWGVW